MRGVSEGTAAGLGSFVSHLAPRGLVHSVFHSLSLPLPASHSVPSGEARSRRDGMEREEAGVVVPRVPLLPAPSGRSRSAGEVNEGQRNRVSRDRSGKRPRDSGGLERRA